MAVDGMACLRSPEQSARSRTGALQMMWNGKLPCSQSTWRLERRRRVASLTTAAVVLLLSAVSRAGEAGPAELHDAAARLEFAFYTEDEGGLLVALESLEKATVQPPFEALARSYIGYGYWKRAQLLKGRDEKTSAAAAQQCVDRLVGPEEPDHELAEIHAIRAACLGLLASLSGAVRAPLYGRRAGASMQRARELDPGNPRVLLVDAVNLYERPAAFGGDREQALLRLSSATAAFEDASGSVDTPEWGQAEAWALLGRAHLERGDRVAARDALERALLIAPGYVQAQSLLSESVAEH